MKTASAKPVRCAIYTRVSTDQGLEQDFNSLDAQYDASLAYIRSVATTLQHRLYQGDFQRRPLAASLLLLTSLSRKWETDRRSGG